MYNFLFKSYQRLKQLDPKIKATAWLLFILVSEVALARYGGGRGSSGGGSRGGGGGRSGGISFRGSSGRLSRGGGASSDAELLILFIIILCIFLFTCPYWGFDFLVSLENINSSFSIPFVGLVNPKWRGLKKFVKQRFYDCQYAWMHNDLKSIKSVVNEDHYLDMEAVLRSQIGKDKLNILEDIEVHQVDIKEFSIWRKEFLVSISASMKDYMVCRDSKKPIPGSDIYTTYRFTEFWRFAYDSNTGKWILLSVSQDDPRKVMRFLGFKFFRQS